MSTQKICCAGFGGQGALSLGKILAYAAMLEGKEVSWCPSYGPEMRGGTANCHVIVSDEAIGSPVIAENAACLIAMNQPSLDKFQDIIADGGVIVLNSDLAQLHGSAKTDKIYAVPANTMAQNAFGSAKLANIILLGAVVQSVGVVRTESIEEAFAQVFGGAKEKFIPDNKKAFALGYTFAKGEHA